MRVRAKGDSCVTEDRVLDGNVNKEWQSGYRRSAIYSWTTSTVVVTVPYGSPYLSPD